MAVLFDFYRSPSSADSKEGEEEKFHARVVGGQTLEMDAIVRHISRRCTLSAGDILAVINELHNEIVAGLCDGNRVAIPGIGFFSLSLTAPKDASPTTTHAQHIGIKRIDFRADQRLKEDVKTQVVFERSREKRHSASLSIHEIDTLLADYFKKNGFITCQRFAELCQFTRNTANRHLKRLLEEGRLVNRNTVRQPFYEPAKGFYGK